MPVYSALTAGTLMRELATLVGDLLYDGTTTSGTTTTWVDAAQPWNANDDEGVLGAWWYGTGGTAVDQERISVTTYTASSGTGTFDRAGTSPGSDTTYILTRRYRPTLLLRALQMAQRYQTQRRVSLYPIVGRELVIGSALPNNFDLFTTTNVPDGLTLDGNSTFTNQTTNTLGGRRVLRMVTDGTNAGSVRYSIPGWGRFQSKTVNAYAHIRSSIVASNRVGLQINDGVTTATNDYASTANDWELLSASQAMGDAATQLRISIEVTAGSAVTLDMAYWYTEEPFTRVYSHPIDADRNIVLIGGLRYSASSITDPNPDAHSFSNPPAPGEFWRVFEDSDDTPRRIELDGSWFPQGRVLEYRAWARHAPLSGGATSFTGIPEVILPRAKAFLYQMTGEDRKYAEAAKEAAVVEAVLATRIPTGWKRIQSQ